MAWFMIKFNFRWKKIKYEVAKDKRHTTVFDKSDADNRREELPDWPGELQGVGSL